MLNTTYVLLYIMIISPIFLILHIIFYERTMLFFLLLSEKIFRVLIKKDMTLGENAFVSKVAEEFNVPYIKRKISLERMERSINNQQRKFLKNLWNKRALASRIGVCAVRENFIKHSERDAEFFLKDFEIFAENSLSSLDFDENVKLWCETTGCLTTSDEVLYFMYIAEIMSRSNLLATKLFNMNIAGQMILYAYNIIQEKGFTIKKTG